jgi:hypothetical protein
MLLLVAAAGLAALASTGPMATAAGPTKPAPAHGPRSAPTVTTELELRRAWADATRTRIDLGADIALRDCHLGDPIRESPYPMVLDGHGFTIRQTCFEKRVLRQDGTGWLDIRDVTLTRGGSDGPGAALTSRGEILLSDCVIRQNLAEEPGGGVFSMRRVTAYRCHINGNLANDDGGGIYARRGGVQVYDSVLSTNLVDGSGGAIGSTGDILVVDSIVDGNTTDGDGGALYTDEDGDVTVIRSLIDGSDADGPGGAIFTLDGDVAVLDSTLNGNRADDRGGAISGEADVLVVNSTVARNLAVAHAGGGIWARGRLVLVNSTVTDNYAEGEGGGLLAAGRTAIIGSTVVHNIASVGGNIGSSGPFTSFASILGPPVFEGVTGDTIPTRRSCRVSDSSSLGYNFVTDDTCELDHATDVTGEDPMLAQLEDDPHGFVLVPVDGSPVRGRIPSGSCRTALPDPLPAGQLLSAWLDWDEVLSEDAVGTTRDAGAPCDIGAVQSPSGGAGRPQPDVPPLGAEAPPALAVDPATNTQHRLGGSRSLDAALDALARRLRVYDRLSRRFGVLMRCSTRVGIDRAGDRRHRWGSRYDEGDGTGLDLRPALVPHESAGRPRWVLFQLATNRGCLSRPADPNGAGDDARARSHVEGPRALARRLRRLERTAATVEQRTERFDAWESCLTWLPMTEAGDVEQGFGHEVADGPAADDRLHRAAVDIDHSEWDDPDYQILALRGRDRPFGPGECGTDPGEAPDRPAPRGAIDDIRQDLRSLREDVEDLGGPVDEIDRFDQCLYTVGVRASDGYMFRDRSGAEIRRPALSFDMRGAHLPELSVMAFPGEEPPQIECNEDAGGVETDE